MLITKHVDLPFIYGNYALSPFISLNGRCDDYILVQFTWDEAIHAGNWPRYTRYNKANYCDAFRKGALPYAFCIDCVTKSSEELYEYSAGY